MQIKEQNSILYGWFERPVAAITLALRMLLGAGLGIALILKVYMFILTPHRCEAGASSIGNTIRCTPVIDMIATTLLLVVALGFVAALFARKFGDLRELLLMTLIAVILGFLSGVSPSTAGWQTSMVLVALFAALLGLLAVIRFFGTQRADEHKPGSGSGNWT